MDPSSEPPKSSKIKYEGLDSSEPEDKELAEGELDFSKGITQKPAPSRFNPTDESSKYPTRTDLNGNEFSTAKASSFKQLSDPTESVPTTLRSHGMFDEIRIDVTPRANQPKPQIPEKSHPKNNPSEQVSRELLEKAKKLIEEDEVLSMLPRDERTLELAIKQLKEQDPET